MAHFVASAVVFALGLLFVGAWVPGVRVRGGLWGALKAALVCGILSTFFGKVLVALLTLILFLPVLLTGPVGAFVVRGLVNAILLAFTARLSPSISFDRRRALLWAAFALTVLQVLVGLVA